MCSARVVFFFFTIRKNKQGKKQTKKLLFLSTLCCNYLTHTHASPPLNESLSELELTACQSVSQSSCCFVMSALQVEWVTFTTARETIIAEVSRQLNLEDELQLHHVLLATKSKSAANVKESIFFVRVFQMMIPRTYRYDFLNNIDVMKVLILPPVFCIGCLVIAGGIDSFDSQFVLYPMLITVVILLLIATLNVIATLRYKKAERYELKDQVYGILEHYVTSIESCSTKQRIGSFLGTSSPSTSPPVSTTNTSATASAEDHTRVELNSGNSHVCIVSVYREKQWQRLPSLLLVKGDIISLMVGWGPVFVSCCCCCCY